MARVQAGFSLGVSNVKFEIRVVLGRLLCRRFFEDPDGSGPVPELSLASRLSLLLVFLSLLRLPPLFCRLRAPLALVRHCPARELVVSADGKWQFVLLQSVGFWLSHVCDWERMLISNAADLLGVSDFGLFRHARVW
ncbi:hypothetical protein Nepgr_023157 [Nepenthes gracilis]|uniref:Uncharacterized protein n=1 Tax=Nepenthes gracilis TaxID=150966 RepID=A0AAD3XYU8_NEPGR|nr:hypothetical protein Nepgr_023157 [Nepenthes gracilis]